METLAIFIIFVCFCFGGMCPYNGVESKRRTVKNNSDCDLYINFCKFLLYSTLPFVGGSGYGGTPEGRLVYLFEKLISDM